MNSEEAGEEVVHTYIHDDNLLELFSWNWKVIHDIICYNWWNSYIFDQLNSYSFYATDF